MKQSKPSTNSYDFSKVEDFLLKLFQEFGVHRVNHLPIEARQSIITMVDVEKKRQDARKERDKFNDLDLTVVFISQNNNGMTVQFRGGLTTIFPLAYRDHFHHCLISGERVSIDLAWPYIEPQVRMMTAHREMQIYEGLMDNGT